MKTASIVSTKGGPGKTTTAASLGAFCADAGLRTLLIDLDPVQPSLSSYYPLLEEAQGGIYDLLAFNVTDCTRIVSSTTIPNLSLVISNDINNHLINLILQAPDGRLRLANLMPAFEDHFDLVLIDTQGARSAMLEMVVLASDLAISPLQPNMLTAREFSRGTMQMLDGLRAYGRLGLNIPPVRIVVNCLDLTADAQMIYQSVREIFQDNLEISVLDCTIPAAVVFRNAASRGIPAHRLEYRQPSNRQSPSALSIIRRLAIEVFPEWRDRFESVTEETMAALVKGGR
ncbi:cobyrinic acid a,c-diamide synthase [Pseudomonas taeanensis MS-3]|jgi:chromosome partitioning related protein ParA|uniref:Cobyrinic acid a,c-diamide synthase n=1 Tax=Pseudomonas taeanensis MS-3 TaxID=1395571 RepID=A0A0A1YE95_9PSED|nr:MULTISPECIES: ParA family protein [Pseudomonas]KFX68092.1 cobyrinic acid a,c-diamide synthase [Pseudomonas taeanensis MS-3]OEO24939.1 cobyrinic acid a,c-diamide synthase [Pseudomonas sp. J237]HBX57040.1 ParA family protein [Pseudomonas sp.]|tara:strand:+ start:20572 stop:21432 length:861 start_codon:yes stop_codon:yes gene_type:complete